MTIFFLNMCEATGNSTTKHFTYKWQFQRVEIIAIGESAGVRRRLWTVDCRLRTTGKTLTECKMQTAD